MGMGPYGMKLSWRERIGAFRNTPAIFKLVWQERPSVTVVTVLLRLVRAGFPVALLWVSKLIIDAVIEARQTGPVWPRLMGLVALELSIVVLGDWLGRVSSVMEGLFGETFSIAMSVRIMEHAATLDLGQFENPAFYDQLDRARSNATGPIQFVMQLFQLGQGVLTLFALSAALLAFNPLLFVLLVASTVPA